MEVIDDVALKVRLPSDIASNVVKFIERSEVISSDSSHQEVLVFW